jgi:PAS domain S-box-containing protein
MEDWWADAVRPESGRLTDAGVRDLARQTFDAVREPLLVLDAVLCVQAANAAFYATFEVLPENTIGRPLYGLGDDQWNIPGLRELLEDLLPARKQIDDFEVEHEFKNLGPRTMLLTARQIGATSLILLAIQDITDWKRAAVAVSQALEQAEKTIDTVREPMIVLDEDLRVRSANQAFYRLFGGDSEQTLGKSVYELRDSEWDIPALHALLEDVLPNDHLFNDFMVEHEFGDLGRRTLLLNARRIDHVQLVLLAFEDITERQRALEALKESELRYRRLFEAAQDGILILDAATGQITDANPFIQGILGYSRAELLGQQLWDVGLLEDMRENEAKFRELQDRGYVRYDHLPLKTPSGDETEVEFVSNVYPVDGQLVIQCNIRDIGDRRRLERDKERHAEELLEMDRRKDEFLAMLSHELRNPLAPIVNAVHLLRLQPDHNSIEQQAVEVIDRQSSNLTHLVNELLEVSRITTGRIQLERQRILLGVIIRNAVETASSAFEQRNQTLTVTIPSEPIWLDADSTRMEQVVVNLLTNAAKYTPHDGQVSINVESADGKASIQVRDTGIGIPADVLPHIFDLFTQAERSLARSEGGLGIGLAVVKRLTEMHGGTVSVSSIEGQGSEFVVHLPEALPSMGSVPQGRSDTADAMATHSLRVLVVDDSPDLTRMLRLTFQLEGHEVQVAHDGPSALQAALDLRPQVVLLDIGLPGWDGYEVARRIRLEPMLDGVVLVAMTGYGRDSDRQLASEAGFDHHLVKPPDFAKLEAIFATVPAK